MRATAVKQSVASGAARHFGEGGAQGRDVDWLGQVTGEAGGAALFQVGIHSEAAQRDPAQTANCWLKPVTRAS
jgi:hypothetical protein